LEHTRTNDGQEHWTHSDLDRPIKIQTTHINLIPKLIIKNALTLLGLTKRDFTSGFSRLVENFLNRRYTIVKIYF